MLKTIIGFFRPVDKQQFNLHRVDPIVDEPARDDPSGFPFPQDFFGSHRQCTLKKRTE
jgi:hypothetical protein